MNIGDRVIFVNNPEGYSIGRSNPIKGSEWFCEGIVTKVGSSIGVAWDNKEHNSYVGGCLQLVDYLDKELFEI